MINATHYVLDLETMGKGPRAAIVAIGCVRIEKLAITSSLYRRVRLETSLQVGLQVDASTIEWWLQQNDAARAEIHNPGGIRLESALAELADFMGKVPGAAPSKTTLLWGNGSSFDNVIVGNAFDACGIDRPWHFWNDRDLRTLLAIFPAAKTLPFEGVKHHAEDDAMHEAKQLLTALQFMAASEEEAHA
ncbi:3' exoribonuclease, RNase T-like [compost metagenome]